MKEDDNFAISISNSNSMFNRGVHRQFVGTVGGRISFKTEVTISRETRAWTDTTFGLFYEWEKFIVIRNLVLIFFYIPSTSNYSELCSGQYKILFKKLPLKGQLYRGYTHG